MSVVPSLVAEILRSLKSPLSWHVMPEMKQEHMRNNAELLCHRPNHDSQQKQSIGLGLRLNNSAW